MGRLVDTDELTEVMTSDWFINLVLGTNSRAAIKETFSDYIDRIPTAYDIEKVVDSVRADCYTIGFDESQTEILVDDVRKGGAK